MWRPLRLVAVVTATVILTTNAAFAQKAVEDILPDKADIVASARLMDSEGMPIGEAFIFDITFGDDPENVLAVGAFAWGPLTPGFHAFHIHGVGSCDPASESPFSGAGGHYDPDGTEHGSHAGDLPSLRAREDGTAFSVFITDAFTVEDLIDEDGSAFIIHAGRDNYANIPERYGSPDEATLGAGDAGSRVACGVIEAGPISEAG
jgi:Cu-Zn family superoxide dismutase